MYIYIHVYTRIADGKTTRGKKVKGMGWLRLVDSLKLQVFFAEYRLLYRALLQKRPILVRSILIEATS